MVAKFPDQPDMRCRVGGHEPSRAKRRHVEASADEGGIALECRPVQGDLR
jgi:hypothetical protein